MVEAGLSHIPPATCRQDHSEPSRKLLACQSTQTGTLLPLEPSVVQCHSLSVNASLSTSALCVTSEALVSHHSHSKITADLFFSKEGAQGEDKQFESPYNCAYNCGKLLITDPVLLSVEWEENKSHPCLFISLGFKLVAAISILCMHLVTVQHVEGKTLRQTSSSCTLNPSSDSPAFRLAFPGSLETTFY